MYQGVPGLCLLESVPDAGEGATRMDGMEEWGWRGSGCAFLRNRGGQELLPKKEVMHGPQRHVCLNRGRTGDRMDRGPGCTEEACPAPQQK